MSNEEREVWNPSVTGDYDPKQEQPGAAEEEGGIDPDDVSTPDEPQPGRGPEGPDS